MKLAMMLTVSALSGCEFQRKRTSASIYDYFLGIGSWRCIIARNQCQWLIKTSSCQEPGENMQSYKSHQASLLSPKQRNGAVFY